MTKDILKRLNSLNLSDDDIIKVSQVAEVLGIGQRRVRVLVKPKNPITPSRIKSTLNPLHQAYEVRVGDLREFIMNDYAHTKPGRPRTEGRDRTTIHNPQNSH